MEVEREVELSGGNTSVVIRIGETVHRSTGRWTESVHGLLRHLEITGFEGVPRVIGFDEKNREVLSYLHGQVPVDAPWPAYVWSKATLEEVGHWLRGFHRAVAAYQPGPQSRWWYGEGAAAEDELICHNDFAPYNTVFRAGRIVGVIDWDVAGPANPLWDLAFCAWSWVPLHNPKLTEVLRGPCEAFQASRMKILSDSYGHTDAASLVPMIVDRVMASRDGLILGAEGGDPVMRQLVDAGHLADIEQTLKYLQVRRKSLVEEIKCNESAV